MGYAKIWFGSNFLGTEEDYIYLDGYLLEGLRSISFSPEIDMLVVSDEKEMFRKLIKRLNDLDDNNIYRYVRNFGTMTDDFLIFSFMYENNIHIMWKLINNDTPFFDLNTLDTNIVNSYKIGREEYINNLKSIENKLLAAK